MVCKENIGDISDVHGQCCYIEWKIEDFFLQPSKVDDEWKSSPFFFSDATWHLSIFPNGKTEDESYGYINLYLNRVPHTSNHKYFFIFGIKRNDNVFVLPWTYIYSFDQDSGGYTGIFQLIQRSVLKDCKEAVIKKGTLSLVCIIHITNECKVDSAVQTSIHTREDFENVKKRANESECENKKDNCTSRGNEEIGELEVKIPPACSRRVTVKKDIGNITILRGRYCSVDWKIEDYFLQSSKEDINLLSSKFHFSGATWRLSVWPNGKISRETGGYLDMFLKKVEPNKSVHYLNFIIGIKENNGKFYEYSNCIQSFQIGGHGRFRIAKTSDMCWDKRKVAVEGAVTFFCIAYISSDQGIDTTSQTSPYDCLDAKTQTYMDLFLNKKMCDVTLRVEGREFHAHSLVLCIRSSAFVSQLEHCNRRRKIIEITDCDPNVFQDFLLYLYTSEMRNISTREAIALYNIANRYELPPLKQKCVQQMLSNLSAESVCDAYLFAKEQSEKELQKLAQEYFTRNTVEIFRTREWPSFMAEHSSVANALLLGE